jgi:hypothetical protein
MAPLPMLSLVQEAVRTAKEAGTIHSQWSLVRQTNFFIDDAAESFGA